MSLKRSLLLFAGLGIALLTAACDEQATKGPLTREQAVQELNTIVAKVAPTVEEVGQVSVQPGSVQDTAPKLPPVDSFKLTVEPNSGAGYTVAEIFGSTEKAGKGTDGWMVEAAQTFNARQYRLSDGTIAQIAVRPVASGTAYDLISWGAGKPDGFSPSNELWIEMAKARGVEFELITNRLVGNVAGVVMKEELAKRIETERGALGIAEIVDEVVQGKAVAGYTDPFASSTGLNFLVSVLQTFAKGDEAQMLSPDVTAAFEAFQKNIPFVAQTTMQMRDSVQNDGSLDTFVMERQTFVNTESLRTGYRFVPFGVRHNNPLYALAGTPANRKEALKAFANFAATPDVQKTAERFGFEPSDSTTDAFLVPTGSTLIDAQKVWKQKKDAGKRIAAVFLADVSGSMDGDRIVKLKEALKDGAANINPKNTIGLVVFSSNVRTVLQPAPFTLLQKARFMTAVDELTISGGTNMYDGIAVSLQTIVGELAKDPTVKPVLFVLTDGENTGGHSYGDLEPIVRALNIPVHTIGFEANIAELGRVSSLVEAASINAGVDDVAYKIAAMLNSQM